MIFCASWKFLRSFVVYCSRDKVRLDSKIPYFALNLWSALVSGEFCQLFGYHILQSESREEWRRAGVLTNKFSNEFLHAIYRGV